MNNTAVFLGRFAPFHKGHSVLLDIMIKNKGVSNCLIMIGSSNTLNERTPYTYEQRAEMIKAIYPEIKIMPLPDGKAGLVYFDGSTNDIWLDNIEKVQQDLNSDFVFYGGSKEDLLVLSERFKTVVLFDRSKNKAAATNVRKALMENDTQMLEKLLDPKVIPLAKAYYQDFLNSKKNGQSN